MIIVNVFDDKNYEMGFGGQPVELIPYTAKSLKLWATDLRADWVFNLAFFNMGGAAGVKFRTLQYLYVTGRGICGWGGTDERLSLPNGSIVSGWKIGIRNGVIVDADAYAKRSRNMLGVLGDGRIVSVQTDLVDGKGYTERAVCELAIQWIRKYYAQTIALLLIMDAGGSTGCYCGRPKLMFAPEVGRPVPSVFWVRRRESAPKITRTLVQGCKGWDVMLLQSVIGGCEIDGSFGPATRARVIVVQKALGLVPDGSAGPKTLAALGLR